MDKTFDVEGISKIMIIYRGGLLQAGKKFKVTMTEQEFNCFRDYIDLIKCEEVGANNHEEVVLEASKSESVIEVAEEAKKEPKGEDKNVVSMQRKSGSNKNSNKSKVQS